MSELSSTSADSMAVPSVSITTWWTRFRTSTISSFWSGASPLVGNDRRSVSDMLSRILRLQDGRDDAITKIAKRLRGGGLRLRCHDRPRGVEATRQPAIGWHGDVV